MKKILFFVEKILLHFWFYLWIEMQSLWRKRNLDLSYKGWDFNRFSSLELIADEIYEKNVIGNVAELWVYKWEFACKINEIFPDRKLYLFDTFQWFDKRDTSIEQTHSFSTGKQDFSHTSVEWVLAKMPNRDNIEIRQWYFPESLNWLQDTFCFVSLDPDLYKPILDGLEYFYPRLSHGGYIFVHDYNNSLYKWAKQAVREFCEKNNINYFPLSDNWGTAVITK